MGPPQIGINFHFILLLGRKAQAKNLERKFGYTYLSITNLVKMEEEKYILSIYIICIEHHMMEKE